MALLIWFIAPAGFAQTITWTGSGGDLLWSTPANWDLVSAPTYTNAVVFADNDTGTAGPGPTGISNNIVDVSQNILSLQYKNLSGFHNTYIPTGNVLVITGSVTRALCSGTFNSAGDGAVVIYGTITGGGAIVISNSTGVLNVRQGMTTPSGGHAATLDMSGLDTFHATVDRVLVAGDGGSAQGDNRLVGTLILGKTNVIKMTGSPGMTVGRSVSNSNLGSGDVQLGQTNLWLCDAGIALSYGKSSGFIEFQPGLISPVVVFRNASGTGRMANWAIGDDQFGAQTGTRTGNADFSLGKVDALVDTIIIGRGMNSTSTGDSVGILTLADGVIDANNVIAGTRYSGGNRIGGSGTITVTNTAQFIVNSDMLLGGNLGSVNATLTFPKGFLNVINGGFVWVKGNINDGMSPGGLTSVNVTNASLKVGGQIGASITPNTGPLENFNLDTAILTLTLSGAINAANPVASVTNLSINNSLTVNIQGGGFTVGQYPLIKYYSGTINGSGFSVAALGTLPSRTFAYLSNNITTSSIDLVVTNISFIKWDGNVAGGNWDTNGTLNWKDTVTGLPSSYLETIIPGDTTLFDDSATGTTTVNLANILSPTTVTVSNATKPYVFKGPGALGGNSGPLTKAGAATLVITNTGFNSFGGPLNINGGLIQLGLAANRLPTTANVTLADTAGVALDLGGVDQALNALTGGGASGGNVNLGAGNLQTSAAGTYAGVISGSGHYTKVGSGEQVFSGANLYSGGTTISGGSLTLANASGNGSGSGTIDIGVSGTLNIGNGGTSGSVPGVQVITNNGVLTFNRTDSFTLPNFITGTGAVTKNNTNIVTITTANSYGGQTTIAGGALRASNSNALGSGAIYVVNAGDNTVNAITAISARLEMIGGINLTNALLLDQKGGAYGDAPSVESVSGNNTLSGPISLFLGGSYWTFRSDAGKLNITGPVAILTAGTRNLRVEGDGDGEWVSNIPEGTGTTRLFKDGPGAWTLSGTNTYTSFTEVFNGKLIVNGEIQSPNALDVFTNAILGGTGVILSPIEIWGGGTLSPGASIGTLTVLSTLTCDTDSTNLFEVNSDTLAHDQVAGLFGASFGGTLVLSLSGGGTALTNGAAIQLFDGTGFSGGFAGIVPPTPGAGKVWDTSTLTTDGTLRIVANAPTFNSVTKLGDQNFELTISGSLGLNYTILASTNVALPVSNWTVLSSGTIGSSPFTYDDLTATNFPRRFYIMTVP